MACEDRTCLINKSDPVHTCIKQQWKKKIEITFASLSKNSARNNKKKRKTGNAIAKLFALHANTIKSIKTSKQNQN